MEGNRREIQGTEYSLRKTRHDGPRKTQFFPTLDDGKRLVTHEEPPRSSVCDGPEIEPNQLPEVNQK